MNDYNKSPDDDIRTESQPDASQNQEVPPPTPTNVPQPAPPVATMPGELTPSEIQSKKLASGLLGILLGALGIHKFYLGYQREGIIMILVTLLGGVVGSFNTCGLLFPVAAVMPVIGLVEGILYLIKSDQEFADTYLRNRKPWF